MPGDCCLGNKARLIAQEQTGGGQLLMMKSSLHFRKKEAIRIDYKSSKDPDGIFIGKDRLQGLINCFALVLDSRIKSLLQLIQFGSSEEDFLSILTKGQLTLGELRLLFDIDALTRTMNYEPIVAGTQSNGFAGTKANENAGQARMETGSIKDYILLPLWTVDPPFSQDLKKVSED
ncbi:hypothetical protein Tco_0428658 [Tanacetum coccineum]